METKSFVLKDTDTVNYTRNGSKIDWKVNKSHMGTRTAMDIMTENGYHPAGYGAPFNEQEEGDYYYFQCWSSCD